MAKYYFKVIDYSRCVERCNLRDDGTMIGSMSCQTCKLCKDSDADNNWIDCEKLKEALNQK